MKQPYRVPIENEVDEPRRSLVYTTEDPEKHVWGARRFLRVFFVASALGTALIMMGYGVAGAVTGTLGIAWAIVRMRQRPRPKSVVLEVKGGTLDVMVPARDVRRLHISLCDLHDVRLQSKSYEHANAAAGALGALEFDGRGRSRQVTVARIVLVDERGHELVLSEQWRAHFDCMEWLGRIRAFLRSHGWLPAEERASHQARTTR